ncbi:MAG: hypothetical protein EOM02_00370 [Synergistales bacterium]|nr:hypothetical protein [Synergistales bacterium]
MNTSTFVDLVRIRINDVQKALFVSDREFCQAINDGMMAITRERIAFGDPWFMKTLLVSPGTTIPSDFLGFAGQFPVVADGGALYPYDDEDAVYVRYHRSPDKVQSISPTEEIDFPEPLIPSLIQFVSGLLLIRTSMDVSAEMSMSRKLAGLPDEAER